MRRPLVRMADVMAHTDPVTAVNDDGAVATADFQSQVVDAETDNRAVEERQGEESQLRSTSEILEELSRIVTEVAADDDVAESTTTLIREVANRTLARSDQRLKDAPTTESWHSPKERLMLSMESIGETLKKVWEAIKAAALRVYEALMKAVMSFIGVLESALRLAEDLQKDLPGLNWADATPITSAAAKNIAVNNKLSAQWPKETLTTLERCVQVDHEIYDIAKSVADDYVADFEQAMRNNKISENWDAQAERCQGLYKGLKLKLAAVATTPSGKSQPGGKGTVIHASGLLPGDKRIQFFVPEDKLDSVPFMIAFEHCLVMPGSVHSEPFPQNAPKPRIDKLPAVDKAVLRDGVDGLVTLIKDMLKNQQGRQSETKARQKKINSMNMGAMKAVGDEALDAQSKNLLMVLAKMAAMPMAVNRPVNKYVMQTLPEYLTALRHTVKAYS